MKNNSALEKAHRALRGIERLPENWNENGAPPFSKEHVKRVRELVDTLIRVPRIAPSACSGIALEYRNRYLGFLCFEIFESGLSEMLYVDSADNCIEGIIHENEIPAIVRKYVNGKL